MNAIARLFSQRHIFELRLKHAVQGAMICLMLCLLSACGEGESTGGSYYNEYRSQVNKTNEYIRKYNSLVRQNFSSDQLLVETALLMGKVDSAVLLIKLKEIEIRADLTKATEQTLRKDLKDHEELTEQAMQAINKLEVQLSQTNTQRLKLNAPSIYKESAVKRTTEMMDTVGAALKQLEGLRAVLDLIHLELREDINRQLVSQGADPIPIKPIAKKPVPTPSSPDLGSVTGVVYAPNKKDPVANALVYAPEKGNQHLNPPKVYKPDESKALSCGEPKENYLSKSCSTPTGSFQLKDLPAGEVQIKVKKGSFELRPVVSVKKDETVALSKQETTLPSQDSDIGSIPKIAVIPGSYDHLEKVLEKLGLAQDKFTVLLGTRASQLLRDPDKLSTVDLLMINCGTTVESALSDVSVRKNLKNFVAQGGRIYATDLSYDFIEQVFPNYIEFHGDVSSSTPGGSGRAEVGTAISGINAKINSIHLKSWLRDGVKCGPQGQKSCLNDDGTVHIGGFLNSWALMNRVHPGAKATVWVEANVQSKVRPLTVSFQYGQGRVLYTSYHTHHAGEENHIYAQERILQYLIFEVVQ